MLAQIIVLVMVEYMLPGVRQASRKHNLVVGVEAPAFVDIWNNELQLYDRVVFVVVGARVR